MRIRDLCAIGTFCAATGVTTGAGALTVSLEECHEGADFIRNAALSRDNGVEPDAFLRRLEDDLVLIQSVPAALRWFVRDEDDEAMLRIAALDVFAEPRGPQDHHRTFLEGCRATVSAVAPRPDAPPVATLPPRR